MDKSALLDVALVTEGGEREDFAPADPEIIHQLLYETSGQLCARFEDGQVWSVAVVGSTLVQKITSNLFTAQHDDRPPESGQVDDVA